MDERSFEVRDEARSEAEGVARADFAVHVPAGLCYFLGHFEGDPVLPAVAQLNNLVLPLVHRAWPAMPPLRRATKLKFHKPIRPGDDLSLRLEHTRARAAVTFVIELGGGVASAGTLHFGEASP